MRIDSGVEMTRLPTGVFLRRTESLVAHEGPIYWSPMTMAETAHGSVDKLFSSEEPGSGAELTGVESFWSSQGVMEDMDERKGKLTSITGWKHSSDKIACLLGWTLMS